MFERLVRAGEGSSLVDSDPRLLENVILKEPPSSPPPPAVHPQRASGLQDFLPALHLQAGV